ncbi:hypothetical protein [Flavobacterium alkalisoli]|uniref:hypothetical protein n=1 Tax=Flavobacterium alkalisoli TaxID=2602769 RepID=UPI003A8FCCCE
MKKIFTLAAIVATAFTFAQDNDASGKYNNLSLNFMASEPHQGGLSYETNFLTSKHGSEGRTNVLNISVGTMSYDVEFLSIDGTGFVAELGGRQYYGKNKAEFKGLYSSNYLSYGNISFDEDTMFGKFDGTYSYFSFFSPEIGYKFAFGNFTLDPFVGAIWKIEIKGQGDVDNVNVDEWAFRGGLKLGYKF